MNKRHEGPKITVIAIVIVKPFRRTTLGAVGDGSSQSSVWNLDSKPVNHVFESPGKISVRTTR